MVKFISGLCIGLAIGLVIFNMTKTPDLPQMWLVGKFDGIHPSKLAFIDLSTCTKREENNIVLGKLTYYYDEDTKTALSICKDNVMIMLNAPKDIETKQ